MAKKKRKVVVRKSKEDGSVRKDAQQKARVVKTSTRPKRTLKKRPTKTTSSNSWFSRIFKNPNKDLLFGRENYILMIAGIALVLIGFVLMSGGAMPDADTWDDNIIYSFRRTVLAPFIVLVGLGVEIFAIFKRPTTIA